LGRADDLADVDDLEAGIALLHLHELLGDLLGWPDQPRAGLHGVTERREVGLTSTLWIARRRDLFGREPGHEAERREHLHVLLEKRRRSLDALLDAVGDVKRVADAEIAAQFSFLAGAGARLAERAHDLVARSARRRPAADDPLDIVLGHEVER